MLFQKSLLSLTQYILLKRFSILHSILTRFMHHPSSKNFKLSSYIIRRIQSNSGSVLAIAIGLFIKLLIRKWNISIPFFSFLAKYHGTLAKKNKCDDIANKWKMTFQASDLKRKHFLDLLNSNDNIIELSYIKGRSWLKLFDYFNSLCTRASRAITNHAPIGKYRLRFFSREEFRCLYGLYPIKTRYHILHKCRRFKKY